MSADDLKRFSAAETQLLLKRSADWIWETDAELRFSWFSGNYQHVTGLDPAEVIGRSRGDLMKQVSLASRSVVSNQSDMEARLPFQDFVYELKAAHSACRWVSISGEPRFDAAGTFLGYRGVGRNMTNLATAIDDLQARYASDMRAREAELEKALREARESMHQTELYRHVLNELPVSVYVKTEALAFEFVNKVWCDISGVSGEDALGRTDRDFFGAEGEGFAERDRAVLASGEIDETEEILTHRDGSSRHLIAKKSRLASSDGAFHLIGSSTDISELKQREAELVELQRQAVLADRAKSEFLANMSHEIRTPMNGVLGMAELLARSDLSPKQRTFTDIIVKSGNALLTIINDILDFSKIDAGQLLLDPRPFNLTEAIEDVAALLSTRVEEKDLELVVRIAPGVGGSIVGDVGRLRQIVTNLIGNAVKFTDRGHVLVDVDGLRGETHTRLRVCVSDTGIGIPSDKLDLVFEKFSQVDASSTRRHEGTGLGLAITSRLVALMDGTIGVESREGEGSTFWFTVELPNAADRKPAAAPVDISGARVLVVDDNRVNRAILVEQVAAWGFDGCAANSGAEGIAVLQAAARLGLTVDCVVLDYQMPRMTGAEAARAIRSMPEGADVPIVMLTSVDHSFPSQGLRELGIDAHLIKPARSAVLFDTIVAAIQARRGAQSSGVHFAPAVVAPAAPAAVVPPPPLPESQPGIVRIERHSGAAAHRVDILVAEDNDVNQLVFTQILSETSYTFQIVGNGILAVKSFRDMNPRMVLMDVSMPAMNGLEATAAIRRLELDGGGRVPIVGVTAHALKGDRERCIEAGMDDYLSKPISPKALMDKVTRWMRGEQRRDRSAG